MSFRKDKGEAGRVTYLKLTDVIFVLASAAISCGMFAMGLYIKHTKANLLTVCAVLFLLPACKKLTNLIVILPHKDIDSEVLKKITEAKEKAFASAPTVPVSFTDMLCSTEDHILKFGDVTVTKGRVLAYSEMNKKLNDYAVDYFRSALKKRGFDCSFAIFTSADEYASAVKRLNIEKEADAGVVAYLHSLMI